MNFNEFKNLIKRKLGTIFNLTFLLVVLVIIFSLLSGLKYSSRSKLLIVQNAKTNDAYLTSRSNEYLGNLLSEVVYSGSFLSLVINNSQYKIDRDYFSNNYNDRLKIWRKTVSTKTVSDTGIIEIDVYHPIPDQARLISLAINDILINNNSLYYGGGGISLVILDQPLVSNYPDKPNLILNTLFSLFFGLFISLIFIYLYPEKSYDIRLWPKRKEKIVYVRKSSPIKVETSFNNHYQEKMFVASDDNKRNGDEQKDGDDNFVARGDMSGIL